MTPTIYSWEHLSFGSLENLFFAVVFEKKNLSYWSLCSSKVFGTLKKYQLLEQFKPHICFLLYLLSYYIQLLVISKIYDLSLVDSVLTFMNPKVLFMYGQPLHLSLWQTCVLSKCSELSSCGMSDILESQISQTSIKGYFQEEI